MKATKYLVILFAGLAWAASPAWSDTATTPPATPPADSDTDTPDPVLDAQRATDLATKFGITQQQVLDMRQTSLMGWGEIKNLLLIAQAVSANSATTPTPLTMDAALTQILAQRAGGMGLGQIAKSYDLKLGKLHHGDIKATETPETPETPTSVSKPEKGSSSRPDKPDRPEKHGKPDKPEKPDHPGHGR